MQHAEQDKATHLALLGRLCSVANHAYMRLTGTGQGYVHALPITDTPICRVCMLHGLQVLKLKTITAELLQPLVHKALLCSTLNCVCNLSSKVLSSLFKAFSHLRPGKCTHFQIYPHLLASSLYVVLQSPTL